MSRILNPQFRPVLAVILHARDCRENALLEQGLREISEQDPNLRIDSESASERFEVAGLSELHLERICDTLKDRYAVNVEVSELRVLYLETIRTPAEAEGKYIRQTGGLGNYAHCWLRVEPNRSGKGNEFIDAIKSGVLPNRYIDSISQGVQSALESGILAGFPMVDIKVVLFDGSYHEADSNEMAFRFAGSIAFNEAARKAFPVLLEPVMDVEAGVPEELVGALVNDINSRRGRIKDISCSNRWCEARAILPLNEALSTSPQGRFEYPMQFAGYEPVPRNGSSEGDELGITVKNPKNPNRGRGFATANPDPDSD